MSSPFQKLFSEKSPLSKHRFDHVIEPETENEKDVFVHISAVKEAGLFNLDEGDKLTYELETGENGKISAVKLSKA